MFRRKVFIFNLDVEGVFALRSEFAEPQRVQPEAVSQVDVRVNIRAGSTDEKVVDQNADQGVFNVQSGISI